MKKSFRQQQKSISNNSYTSLVSKYVERGDPVSLENLSPLEKEEIDRRLKEIDLRIEDIGKICDKKKQKSYEDYNNILKSNKSQFHDELTKLNFKLIEAIKQNTREDFLQKLRKDLNSIKNQVYEKDKELQANNNKLYLLENKSNLLQEEKEFIDKETKNSKQYNMYLKNKLKELEEGQGLDLKTKNEPSFENNTSRLIKTSPLRNRDKELAKLEMFFKRNEGILVQKINQEEKGIKEKYGKYKVMESFKNPIFHNLNLKTKDYQFNQMNSKVSNQEVFFNIPEHDLSSHKTTNRRIFKSNNERSFSWDLGLTKTDKKEIMKNFLEDLEIKKYVYDLLY